MKGLGFVLVAVGFLGGALASVVDEAVVYWAWFAAAVAVGGVGLAIIRMSHREHVRSTERIVFNMQTIEESLRRIAENMTRLNADKDTIDPYDVRHRIEELFTDDLNSFVEARESIAHSYGLSAYAEVMNCFAAGERYLNRVWSASADGYIDEINDYLDRAREQFAASLDKVRDLQAPPQTT